MGRMPYTAAIPNDAERVDVSAADVAVPQTAGTDKRCVGFIAGAAGNVEVTTWKGTQLIIPGLVAGNIVPLGILEFHNANTSAALQDAILALFVSRDSQ